MGVKETTEFRRHRKANLIKVCGNKCNICGYNKLQNALEFHHIDPSQKSYGIASDGTCHDLEKDLAEVKKCILVCANCHREVHANFYTVEKILQYKIFDEDFANELREQKKQQATKTITYCKNCGIKIGNDTVNQLCFTCYGLTRRTCARPSREELKYMIRHMPFTQIALKFNVTDNAIRKWCDSMSLPRKVTEIKSYSDEEWEAI